MKIRNFLLSVFVLVGLQSGFMMVARAAEGVGTRGGITTDPGSRMDFFKKTLRSGDLNTLVARSIDQVNTGRIGNLAIADQWRMLTGGGMSAHALAAEYEMQTTCPNKRNKDQLVSLITTAQTGLYDKLCFDLNAIAKKGAGLAEIIVEATAQHALSLGLDEKLLDEVMEQSGIVEESKNVLQQYEQTENNNFPGIGTWFSNPFGS